MKPDIITLPKFRLGVAVAALLGLVLAAAFGQDPDTVVAQGANEEYVDVGIILEVPDTTQNNQFRRALNIIIVNQGSRTAYDVEAVVKIVSPEDSSFFLAPEDYPLLGRIVNVPVGSLSQGKDRYSQKWSIPALGGLQRESLQVWVVHNNKVFDGDTVKFDKNLYPHEHFGTVTTASFESNLHKGNNTDRVWAYRLTTSQQHYGQVDGNYTLAMSVDDPSPSPGDTVKFTIETDRERGSLSGLHAQPIDLKVAIELTGGLSVSGAPTYPSTNVASATYSNGVFNVGTLKAGDRTDNDVTLPIMVPSNSDGTQQCLTATLTGNPPPGTGPYDDDISDNVAKLCLGVAPAGEHVVFTAGQTALFTWYDCSEKTAQPCGDSVSLELVTLGETAATEAGFPYVVFQPDDVVVQVPDPSGRTTSSDSANSGVLVWSTGHPNFTNLPGAKDRPGVIIVEDFLLDSETTNDPDQWTGPSTGTIGSLKVEVSGPGQLSTWYEDSGNPTEFYGSATDGVLYDGEWWEGRATLYAEFSALGTYNLTMTIKSTYDDDTTDTTAGVEYSDTKTYTFHVGPMHDLEVRDGSANYDVAAGRTAYTIFAVNNGPEDAADATVNIALPPGAVEEDYIASDGTYANGVWTLPGLKSRDFRSSQGKPAEATLTLILEQGGSVPREPATASISLTDNSYNVCISTTRATLPHDNQEDCADDEATNTWYATVCVNTADDEIDLTITVEATCDSTTDRAWNEDVCATSAGAVLEDLSETVCVGWYEGTVLEYPDNNNTAEISARRGVQGAAALRTTKPTAGIGLSWPAQDGARAYGVEVSEDGGANWKLLAQWVTDTEYTHTGIPQGATRHYQIHAIDENGGRGQPFATAQATASSTVVRTRTVTESSGS